MKETRATLIILSAGAVTSLALMFRAANRNPSALLLLAFAAWTVSPFVVLAAAALRSRLPLLMPSLLVTVPSLAIYGALVFARTPWKAGFIFLVVPFSSWVIIGLAALLLRRHP